MTRFKFGDKVRYKRKRCIVIDNAEPSLERRLHVATDGIPYSIELIEKKLVKRGWK